MATTPEDLYGFASEHEVPIRSLEPAELRRRLEKKIFDTKGHQVLYARIRRRNGRLAERIFLTPSQTTEGHPEMLAEVLYKSRRVDTSAMANYLPVSEVALVDEDPNKSPMEALYRDLNNDREAPIWVPAGGVLAIPVKHNEMVIRAIPPTRAPSEDRLRVDQYWESLEPAHRAAMSLRFAFGRKRH